MLEDWDLNRSVMPFDVLGSTCVTLMETILFLRTEVCCLSVYRYGDGSWWFLFLIITWPSKRESTVRVEYVTFFVHTAHRSDAFKL